MSGPLRLLLVEDVAEDAELIQREIQRSGMVFHAVCVEEEEAFTAALRDFQPDLVLSDYSMPAFDGMQALALAHQYDAALPVIIVTGSQNEEIAVECIKAGAADYVIKEHLARLPFAVKGALAKRKAMLVEREAMEALQNAEERFSTIFRRNPLAMSLMSIEDKTLVDVNESWERLFHYRAEEVIGKKIWDIHLFQNSPLGNPDFLTELSREKVLDREFILQNKRGAEIALLFSVRSIKLQGKKYYLNVADDISRERQLQKDMIRLERLESLGLLAGGIAHDFNNILTVILGYLSLARKYPEKQGLVLKSLEESEKAARKARFLTQQLLTFSKGGTPVTKAHCIKDVIEEAAYFMLQGSQVGFESSFSPDLLPVEVDLEQISQVFNNLIINALQAMPGGGSLRVRAENHLVGETSPLPLEKGKYIKIEVEDTGEGIEKELSELIFDPYFTTKPDGTGLGLSICHSIVKQHNGFIAVNSEAGQGTTFTLYLPVSTAAVVEREPQVQEIKMGSGKILVMDDDDTIRMLLEEILPQLGYQAAFVRDGHEAISLYKEAILQREPFSAVILDLTIPGSMGGKETIRHLLKIDPKTRAIVSSGYAENSALPDYQAYGFADMLAKPYRLEELSQVLHRVVGQG